MSTAPARAFAVAARGGRGLVLRAWQEAALERLSAWQQGPFLLSAAPGAGKTIPSLVYARGLLNAGIVRRVHVVCPTTPLTRQWAEAAGRVGVQLAPDSDELHPPRDFDGIVATYARVAASAKRWAPQCGERTLVIADECHHLGDELAWGEGFTRAFAGTARWLLLSGTPFRSDQCAIAGVRYEDGVAVPDVSYSYAEAVRDGICRPVAFIPYDGTLSWQSGDDVIESSFDDVLSGREASRRYRTAISTELADGLPRILRAAHERLEQVRAEGHRDAGGLVVAADGEHARRVAEALKEITGKSPVVVLHTDARAAQKLRAFGRGRERWIVAVNMVSEGVDIPRLRVGVYATAAKTPLIFRQIVGRFVRTLAGRPAELSYLFLPADRLLRMHAAEVEDGAAPRLAAAGGAGRRRGCSTSSPSGALSEPDLPAAFLPLAADVAPQLALFGGGPPAPAGRGRSPSRARPRSPTPSRSRRCRPSSAARACATSATASSRRWRASRAARTARSTRGSTARRASPASATRRSSSSSARSSCCYGELDRLSRRRAS